MKIRGVPFQTIDSLLIKPTTHAGDPGTAIWRTLEAGNARVRLVEYSLGYIAYH